MEVLVIGLGRFGTSVSTTLAEGNVSVSIVDIDENKVKKLAPLVDNSFIFDTSDIEALKEIGIEHYDKVVIALGKNYLNHSLLTALNLKELGVNNIIAKASSFEHCKLFTKIGVDQVIQPEYDMGKKLAIKINGSSLLDSVELSNDVRIDNVKVDAKLKKLCNKTIQEINLRKKFKVNIVSIQRGDEVIIPDSNTIILKEDILIIIGKNEDLLNFEKHYKID